MRIVHAEPDGGALSCDECGGWYSSLYRFEAEADPARWLRLCAPCLVDAVTVDPPPVRSLVADLTSSRRHVPGCLGGNCSCPSETT